MMAVQFTGDAIAAAQAVLLALIAAWVAVRTRQISASVRRAELRADREKERCDQLERRVKELEGEGGCCGESGGQA